ncbi:fungal-specific transcription factor domain-containing protein [Coprinopsis sp. MPI-PUGE-AT-0042]|nr:fungal-specific transcription factor domain-containing protein [Coprinopsis sp. MPI-PUGE-AT-0042]
MSDLRHDDLAREILDRVDMGPYGPSGRRTQVTGVETTKEDFFASVLKSHEMSHTRNPSRAFRQSRVSREIVSSSRDHGLSVAPTKEWQDALSQRLALAGTSTGGPHATAGYTDTDTARPAQRRRLNADSVPQTAVIPDWSNLYTIDPHTDEELPETTNELGQLSLDDNQEVRFHGKQSGLHLLGRSLRPDQRIEGGTWRLPMARVWPSSTSGIPSGPIQDVEVHLPPIEVQDRLVNIYMTYIHPTFPVLHKTSFLSDYHSRKFHNSVGSPVAGSSSSQTSPKPEPCQEITPLLLLSIFAIAARFDDEHVMHSSGRASEAGSGYVEDARRILHSVRHSRLSVVQAVVLLGYREFGIGSMEQGWLLVGMGIRMAYDLGLNCDSSQWKLHDKDLFSPQDTQARRQIWWCCFLTDKFGSVYMGRPLMIKDGDYDVPLPDIDPVEEREPWQPVAGASKHPYPPAQARVMSSFCSSSRLMAIIGTIVTDVYPINPPAKESRQKVLADIESRLDQWLYTLPEPLRLDSARRGVPPPPPPQILFLHIRYWGAVLLLHRAYIPNWKRMDDQALNSTIGYRAFDLARGAACQMSSIMAMYRETFTLDRCSPFLTCYLLMAGIMHVLTLTLRPENVEASIGLEHCKVALKDMERAWPSASRAWDLLNGAHVSVSQPNGASYTDPGYQARSKRPAEDAFGHEGSEYSQQETFVPNSVTPLQAPMNQNGVQDLGNRMMAHMLGLDIPGVEPSTTFFQDYEWWPRSTQDQLGNIRLSGTPLPMSEAPSRSGQAADSSMLPPLEMPMPRPSMNQGAIDWPTVPNQHQQHQQQPRAQAMNDLNLNYSYNFQNYGV